jgi:hypothetical protein
MRMTFIPAVAITLPPTNCSGEEDRRGEGSLHRAVTQFVEPYHLECPHQGKVISCSLLPLFGHHHDMLVASNVTNASADSSSSSNAPHNFVT